MSLSLPIVNLASLAPAIAEVNPKSRLPEIRDATSAVSLVSYQAHLHATSKGMCVSECAYEALKILNSVCNLIKQATVRDSGVMKMEPPCEKCSGGVVKGKISLIHSVVQQ